MNDLKPGVPGGTPLNSDQRKKLEELWFVYGNNGPKHSHANHRFIQCLLEAETDHRNFFKPSSECEREVTLVLRGLLK